MTRVLVHRGATLRERLEHTGWTETPSGCWEWNGGRRGPNSYGICSTGDKRRPSDTAHRIAYRAFVGPIPEGMFVCHHCDNPPCMNPAHLFLGTAKTNRADMLAKNRGNFAKGIAHGLVKTTDDQVASIRAEYARGGISYRQLGLRYGVTASCIYQLVRMKSRP